jgi:hypothetical protein
VGAEKLACTSFSQDADLSTTAQVYQRLQTVVREWFIIIPIIGVRLIIGKNNM